MNQATDKTDLLAVEISAGDIADCGWLDAVAELQGRECEGEFEPLFKKAEELKREGRLGQAAWIFVTGAICSFTVSTEPSTPAFHPYLLTATGRSPSPEDLTEEHLALLSVALPSVPMLGLSARIADLLWTLKRDHWAANLAVEKYLASVDSLDKVDSWPHPMHWLDRALQLGASLGRKNQGFQTATATLTELLSSTDLGETDNRGIKLVELAIKYGVSVPEDLAERCAQAATKAAADGKWLRARSYWEAATKLERRTDDGDADRHLLAIAESFVAEAESVVASKDDYLVATTLLQSGIAAMRRVPNTSARVSELHERLLEWQGKALKTMNAFSQEVDLSNATAQAQKSVTGRSITDAIVTLALLHQRPRVEDLRESVEDSAKKFVFAHLFPRVITDHEGKVVRQVPSLTMATGEEREEALRSYMVSEAGLHRQVAVHGQIDPAREQIMLEHRLDGEALRGLVEATPLVPPGREDIFRRGLAAGFRGDFLVSTHLLIPELENALRYHLRSSGGIASRIKTDGTQPERMLPDLLKEAGRTGMLPGDLVFDLEGLLVEQGGPNLRHQLAHGMLEYHEYFSSSAQYLWWSILQLCVLPLIRMTPEVEARESEESSSAQDEDVASSSCVETRSRVLNDGDSAEDAVATT